MTKSLMTKSTVLNEPIAKRREDAHKIREHEIKSALFLYFYFRLKTETDLSHEQIESVMPYCFDFTQSEGEVFIKDELGNLPKSELGSLPNFPFFLMENICDSYDLSQKERDELINNYFHNWALHLRGELSGLISPEQIAEILKDF